MEHCYLFASSHGDDSPGSSLDTYSHCARCGTVKHDYRHNGGQTSPNYPLFLVVGKEGWQRVDPKCRQVILEID